VEKQMPPKHEHVLTCNLSKRQRALYDEYMGRSETRAVMSGGNFMGVINVLMQLRKVRRVCYTGGCGCLRAVLLRGV
jgi:SNF2 family DNA or RNA helicase